MNSLLLDIIGYIGMLFIVISLLMTDIKKLRIFNTIGVIITIIWCFLVGINGVRPVLILNASLFVINSYHLYKTFFSKKA